MPCNSTYTPQFIWLNFHHLTTERRKENIGVVCGYADPKIIKCGFCKSRMFYTKTAPLSDEDFLLVFKLDQVKMSCKEKSEVQHNMCLLTTMLFFLSL